VLLALSQGPQVGSAGKPQQVAVPCGGEATVEPKW